MCIAGYLIHFSFKGRHIAINVIKKGTHCTSSCVTSKAVRYGSIAEHDSVESWMNKGSTLAQLYSSISRYFKSIPVLAFYATSIKFAKTE